MTESDDLKELRQRALAPETDANQLFEISAQHPEVYAEVAANPNAYPDLLAWLENVGDDRVKAVVAARRDGLSGKEALATVEAESPDASSGEQETPLEDDNTPTETMASDSAQAAFAPPSNPEPAAAASSEPVAEDPNAPGGTEETEKLAESPISNAATEDAGNEEADLDKDLETEEVATSNTDGDLDATRVGILPNLEPEPAVQPDEDYPTMVAAPAAIPPAYSSPAYAEPVYAEPVYAEPPAQPMMSPQPAAYSALPGYQSQAGNATSSASKSQRSWGVVVLTVLLVLALIGLAIVGTWIVSSRGNNKTQASASESETETTRTTTVMETTVTTTETPTETGKPIPADAVYESHGFFTPTRNIGCSMGDQGISCEIYQRQWKQDCSGGWVSEVDSSGVNSYCNNSDAIGDPQTEATYGMVYYNGDYACEVGQYTGVNCWNSKTGRGFTMRQADHTTY